MWRISPQILKSPSLKLYFLDQPYEPNLILPRIREWNMQSPNKRALNSGNLWDYAFTKWDSSNLLKALLMFDLRSFGASFATFKEFWRTDSGMIS